MEVKRHGWCGDSCKDLLKDCKILLWLEVSNCHCREKKDRFGDELLGGLNHVHVHVAKILSRSEYFISYNLLLGEISSKVVWSTYM